MESISLINPSFSFTFNGKDFAVKKASLTQVIQFQRKAKEIGDQKDAGGDLLIGAYAIFLILNGVDKNITEEYVQENCPGDLDIMDIISKLGFMNQQKAEMARKTRDALVPKA